MENFFNIRKTLYPRLKYILFNQSKNPEKNKKKTFNYFFKIKLIQKLIKLKYN